jgi:hypothetical protein
LCGSPKRQHIPKFLQLPLICIEKSFIQTLIVSLDLSKQNISMPPPIKDNTHPNFYGFGLLQWNYWSIWRKLVSFSFKKAICSVLRTKFIRRRTTVHFWNSFGKLFSLVQDSSTTTLLRVSILGIWAQSGVIMLFGKTNLHNQGNFRIFTEAFCQVFYPPNIALSTSYYLHSCSVVPFLGVE